MARSVLSEAHFQDEKAAFAYVEAHLWPTGPFCPFCGEACRIGRYSTAEAQAFPGQRLGGYRVTCESCCAEMKHLDCRCGGDGARCRAELTTAWNTRRSTTP